MDLKEIAEKKATRRAKQKRMPPTKCREASMSALWRNPINESRKMGTYHLVKKTAKRQRASNAPSPLFLAAEDIGDLQTVQTMKRAKGRKEGRQERYRNREKDPFIGQLKQGIGVAWNRQEVGHP